MADKIYDLGFNGVTHSQGWVEDGKTIITSVQPQYQLDQIVAENKAIGPQSANKKGSVIGARIPALMYHNWKNEWSAGPKLWGVTFETFLFKRLNSPEYKHLRFCKL